MKGETANMQPQPIRLALTPEIRAQALVLATQLIDSGVISHNGSVLKEWVFDKAVSNANKQSPQPSTEESQSKEPSDKATTSESAQSSKPPQSTKGQSPKGQMNNKQAKYLAQETIKTSLMLKIGAEKDPSQRAGESRQTNIEKASIYHREGHANVGLIRKALGATLALGDQIGTIISHIFNPIHGKDAQTSVEHDVGPSVGPQDQTTAKENSEKAAQKALEEYTKRLMVEVERQKKPEVQKKLAESANIETPREVVMPILEIPTSLNDLGSGVRMKMSIGNLQPDQTPPTDPQEKTQEKTPGSHHPARKGGSVIPGR